MKKLHLSEDLALPIDAVTQKLAWLGRTGSGKTYGASKLAEEMLAADAQVVILDAVGVWYGLRLAADGKGKGIEIPVFGGLHGDVPLEPTGGALMANLIVDRGISVVIDVSQFESDAAKARFAHEWGDRFFFRKKAAPSAVHIFIEECQEFVPQEPMKGEERMLHAFQRISKLGRNFGIGVSLISQRPQEVNKKALNQTECLFAFQMTGPQERTAIKKWVEEKGLDEIVDVLPKLKVGEAHVWSPQWLQISKTVQIARKQTFNASSTPVGKQAAARQLAPIDLDQVRKDMAATIERAKAEDPRELRKTILELRAELKRKDVVLAEVDVRTKRIDEKLARVKPARVVEKAVLKDAQVKRLEAVAGRIDRAMVQLGKWAQAFTGTEREVRNVATEISAALAAARNREREGAAAGGSRPGVPAAAPHSSPGRGVAALIPDPPRVMSRSVDRRLAVQRAPRVNDGAGALPKAQQRILDALAWLQGVGIATPDKTQVSLFADLVPGAGHTVSMFGALRSAGLIDYPTPGTATLTDAGRGRADTSTVPQSAEEMQQQVLAKLPKAQREILRVLIPAYPTPMAKEDVAAKAGLVAGAGHTVSMFGRLRSLGLIDYPTPGQVLAEKVLFLEA